MNASSKFFVDAPEIAKPEFNKDNKYVSYSQYTMYMKCPRQYKLAYIDKLDKGESSLNLVFGTAMHEVLQKYIETLYTRGSPEADALPLWKMMKEAMVREIDNPKNGFNGSLKQDDIDEFMMDGKDIIDWVTSFGNRMKYFPSKVYEVVGIELPLIIPLKNNLNYVGYLDIVLKNKSTGMIKIIDLKTASRIWNKWQKSDASKLNQLLLYKKFYSDLHKIPLERIEVEFIVLPRKLMEGYEFAQNRIQRIVPPNGRLSLKEALNSFDSFLEEAFLVDGSFNMKNPFVKNPGKLKKNCKWCPFKGTEHCDSKEES